MQQIAANRAFSITLKLTAALVLFIVIVGWLLPLAIVYAFMLRAWIALQLGI